MKPTECSMLVPLLSLVLCTVSLDPSQIQVYPEDGGISGVFMAMLKTQQYSFNATTAAEVCTSLSVRIATLTEVNMAQRNGLQTCRYGWIKEKLAVIPRVEANGKCGQNKVGVISWPASTSKLFEVFCFNSTGQTEVTTVTTPRKTKAADWTTQDKTTSSSLIHSTLFLSPSPSISSDFSTSVSSTFLSSTVSRAATNTPHSLSTSIAQHPLSTSSSSATSFSSTILPTHPFTFSSSLSTLSNQTGQPTQLKSSFGEVPTACVIIAVMLILMAAAGAVWYFKIKRANRLSVWVRIRHKDAVETEMRRHIDQQCSSKKKGKSNSSDDIILQLEEDTE